MSLYLGENLIANAPSLDDKANVNLTNVTPSGTSLVSGWSMPSLRYIDLAIGASGITYTVGANGYIKVTARSTAPNQFLAGYLGVFQEIEVDWSNTAGQVLYISFPVTKDMGFSVGYSTETPLMFRFIYAQGEQNV